MRGIGIGFINLNVHSEYSFRTSLLKINDIVEFNRYNRFKGCAITDTFSTYGFYCLSTLCKAYNMKPVYGIEIAMKGVSGKGKYPLILLALNGAGLKNIFLINTMAHKQANRPLPVPPDFLSSHKEGLAILCGAELVSVSGKHETLEKTVYLYDKYFKDQIYIEINHSGILSESIINRELIIIREFGLRALSTCEARYKKGDKNKFDNLKSLKSARGNDYSLKTKEEFYMAFRNSMPSYRSGGKSFSADRCRIKY